MWELDVTSQRSCQMAVFGTVGADNSDCVTEELRSEMLGLYIAEWQSDGGPTVSFNTNTQRSASLTA